MDRRSWPYRLEHGQDNSSLRCLISLAAPAVLFNIAVENRIAQSWDVDQANHIRLGVLLKSPSGQKIDELPGIKLPTTVARPRGNDTILLPVKLPEQSGEYVLIVYLVHEWVCWFSEQGSLTCTIRIE